MKKAFALGCLLHPFLLLIHVLVTSSLLGVMDCGKHLREELSEAGGPSPHLCVYLHGQGYILIIF